MPPSNRSSSGWMGKDTDGLDPLVPAEHLIQWMAGAIVHVVIGLVLGALIARLIRSRHLHWSWATVGFALVLVMRAPLADASTSLGVGALAAAVRGRRWHREDLETGVDLAEIAIERHHPFGALRVCATAARSRLVRGVGERFGIGVAGAQCTGAAGAYCAGVAGTRCAKDGRPHFTGAGVSGLRSGLASLLVGGRADGRHTDELALGVERHGRSVSLQLGGQGGGTHTLVVGATGSGKTVTQTSIATQAIARGMAAVIVDPKGDPALRDAVCRAARAAGRRFLEWTPTGPAVYNPCAHGSDTEIADRVLAAERYTEPHYQRQAQRYLGHATRALHRAGLEVSLAGLVRMLDPARLEVLARELAPEDAQAIHDYLDSLTPRQRSDLTGVKDRLAIVVESDVGPWLDPQTDGAEHFDLLGALSEQAVVYFGLHADSRPLLAQMLGGAIVGDLQSAISVLQARPVNALVLIDEFSALAAEHVARLFGRARSAGVSLLLGTQELSDLRLPGSEHLLEQVLGNLTSLIAHRQVVPDSAELIARLVGTRGAWKTSWQRDGRGTRTRVREYLIGPDEVKSLARGHAAVIGLTGHTRVEITRIRACDL